ncbi:MAG: hypothetical protein ABI592_07225 [Acidobacteriota bacterium]
MRRTGILLFAATLALPAAAAPPEASTRRLVRDPALAAVWVTTDRDGLLGCSLLPGPSRRPDTSLDAVRREAIRRGADAVLLLSLSASGIEAELFRCGSASLPPSGTEAPLVPRAEPTREPASVPQPLRPRPAVPAPAVASRPAPSPAPESAPLAASTERQRRARAELDQLKAGVRVVEDPALASGCEKRGGGRADEESLRADAVAANANLLVVVRAEGAVVSGQYFRCTEERRAPPVAPTVPPARR